MMLKRKLRVNRQLFMLFFVVTLMALCSSAANAQHRDRNPQVRRDVHHREDYNRRVVRPPVYYGNSGYYGNDGFYSNGQSYPTRRPTYYPPKRRNSVVGGVLRVILGGGRSSHHRRGY